MSSIDSSNCNQLIVNFPSSRPPRNENYCIAKSVRFASFCDGKYIPYPSHEEIRGRWYTNREMSQFKNEVYRDACAYSRLMSEFSKAQQVKPDTNTVKDFLTRCVGVEHLLSPNVQQRYESIKGVRKNHARTVLEEHASQIESGTCSVERLARVSKNSSRSAWKNSLKRAEMTMLI